MEDDDFVVEEDDDLKKFLGTSSFGKQNRASPAAAQFDKTKRNIAARENSRLKAIKDREASEDGSDDEEKTQTARQKDSRDSNDDEDDDDDDDDSDDDSEDEFPVTHELVLKTHDRPVTTATLDPSGTRLITGSNDCSLKLHDLPSMTPSTIRAFRSVDPSATKSSANVETHPVHQAIYNPLSPSQVLIVTAFPQAKIMSRDGEIQTTFVKGDMYLRDMNNTKGHISEVTSAAWHPTNRDLCVTASTDSTLRIWDINNPRSQKEVIVHKSRAAGSAGRTRMTCVEWGSPNQGGNNILVSAAFDGSLAMWSGEGPYHRPAAEIRDAHQKETWTSGLDISADGRLVVTRGGDDTIKLWDTRKFKEPVNSVAHPSTSSQYPSTNIRFSPNSSSVITGSATGHLHILNPATLRPELVTPVTPDSPLITVLWHPKLNQIITGSANAETHILYSPTKSTGGAVAIMGRAPKRRHIDDDPSRTMDMTQGISGDAIVNPNGLPGTNASASSFAARHPTVGLTASGKPRDPRRPHVPATTPFAKSQPDEKHIKESIPLSSMRNEDPREALLKYAEKAEKDRMFTNAWSKTQPNTIYAELSDDEEEPDKKKAKKG